MVESKYVTVVVCVKNNSKGIRNLLHILQKQSVYGFDIIVVDDYSTDDIDKVKNDFPNVKWIIPLQDIAGKKNALSEGIKQVQSKYVLVTDSDCAPSTSWVESMVCSLEGNDVVLGASPMIQSKGWVNVIARNETILTALQYLGYAARSNPYMGVGRNMLFKKELFDKVSGFDSHLNIMSGDDDLFIQEIIDCGKIGVGLDPNSIVMTTSKTTWRDFLRQKTRHVSTSFEYSWKHKIQLAIFAFSHMLWVLLLGILSFSGTHLFVTYVVALGFWLLMMVGTVGGYKLMKGKDLWSKLPILDVMMAIYYLILGWFTVLNRLGKKSQWN